MPRLADQTSRIIAELERSECGELHLRRGLPLACGVMCFVALVLVCAQDLKFKSIVYHQQQLITYVGCRITICCLYLQIKA